MSNEALSWAFGQSAPSAGAKFVLVALANQVRSDHQCAPGVGLLMSMTGQSDRSVARHLGELVELGLIRRERRNTGYQERLADSFTLLLPANLADSVGAKMAGSATVRQIDHGQNGGIKEPKKITTKTSSPIRDDVERICQHLVDRIVTNGSRKPAVSDEWRTEARLLLDKDGRTEEQVHRAIDWCQDSTFWRGNVMSMPKLREKYDQLRLAARAPAGAAGPSVSAIVARQRDKLAAARS